MPIFSRKQKAHWSSADYEVKSSGLQGARAATAPCIAFPGRARALYNQMLAATPSTFLAGYKLAIERAIPRRKRQEHFVLYWGMSTGGAFLYPLAKDLPPDGYSSAGARAARARLRLSPREIGRFQPALCAVGSARARARARRLHLLHEGISIRRRATHGGRTRRRARASRAARTR